MTLKTNSLHFPIFAPSKLLPSHRHRLPAEVRFSRWNNANAQKFVRRGQTQKQIQDQIRLQKRLDSAHNIAFNYNPAPPNPTFKSTGTPSAPSLPSIPGKKSKYSKPSNTPHHPAFQPTLRPRKVTVKKLVLPGEENEDPEKPTADISIDDKGVSYVFPDAPFPYQYSYTETPKVKPLGMREPLVAPFEPATMGRPWTGRKPLPPSKKKLPEFDSFKLPPPHKKGVKPVQAPGPFLPGSGPKYVMSREEILGDPLTKEEVDALIESCRKSDRQLNIGRDGLTHNMLDNIHAHWKRRRVCKIKCKGVCTVDMDNVRQQLEERTGGKIIFCRGGVIFLFRGRNYNYKSRPRYPLMLWKPVTPVYPRLIKRVPEGLTLEEATEMRKKGRNLTPICKLGKNGVYTNLVKNVREAFEACELVRINCEGMNDSDYRKIGAKLKDLVPCVLISFEAEHILIWRGRDWKSSLPEVTSDAGAKASNYNSVSSKPTSEVQGQLLTASDSSISDGLTSSTSEAYSTMICSSDGEDEVSEESTIYGEEEAVGKLPSSTPPDSLSSALDVSGSVKVPSHVNNAVDSNNLIVDDKDNSNGSFPHRNDMLNSSPGSDANPRSSIDNGHNSELVPAVSLTSSNLDDSSEGAASTDVVAKAVSSSTEGVLLLRKQAIETGSALVLDGNNSDADAIYEKAVAFSKFAPPGPVFRLRPKKLKSQEMQQTDDAEVKEAEREKVPEKETAAAIVSRSENIDPTNPAVMGRRGGKKSSKSRSMNDIRENYLNVAPQGSLRVDELAKLLS